MDDIGDFNKSNFHGIHAHKSLMGMVGSNENGKKEWETAGREMGCLSTGMWGQENFFSPLSLWLGESTYSLHADWNHPV